MKERKRREKNENVEKRIYRGVNDLPRTRNTLQLVLLNQRIRNFSLSQRLNEYFIMETTKLSSNYSNEGRPIKRSCLLYHNSTCVIGNKSHLVQGRI